MPSGISAVSSDTLPSPQASRRAASVPYLAFKEARKPAVLAGEWSMEPSQNRGPNHSPADPAQG